MEACTNCLVANEWSLPRSISSNWWTLPCRWFTVCIIFSKLSKVYFPYSKKSSSNCLMEFHARDWADWIAVMPLTRAAFLFFCRKEPILSTTIVARPTKAGIKAAKPLLALYGYEGGVAFENLLTKPLLVQLRAEELCSFVLLS